MNDAKNVNIEKFTKDFLEEIDEWGYQCFIDACDEFVESIEQCFAAVIKKVTGETNAEAELRFESTKEMDSIHRDWLRINAQDYGTYISSVFDTSVFDIFDAIMDEVNSIACDIQSGKLFFSIEECSNGNPNYVIKKTVQNISSEFVGSLNNLSAPSAP